MERDKTSGRARWMYKVGEKEGRGERLRRREMREDTTEVRRQWEERTHKGCISSLLHCIHVSLTSPPPPSLPRKPCEERLLMEAVSAHVCTELILTKAQLSPAEQQCFLCMTCHLFNKQLHMNNTLHSVSVLLLRPAQRTATVSTGQTRLYYLFIICVCIYRYSDCEFII